MARLVYDFFDGPVADRVIAALKECDTNTIIDIWNKGFIRMDPTNFIINFRSLKTECVSEYCEVTGRSARYFFYGTDEIVIPGITDRDLEIISVLDSLSEEKLGLVLRYLENFFPNEFWDQCNDISRPSRRLTNYLSNLPKGTVTFASMNSEGKETVSDDLLQEFKRYRAAGQSKLFIFDSNLLDELSEFLKVSLHWILRLNVPLYCKTQAGDLIFDRYTLMQQAEKDSLYAFLNKFDELAVEENSKGGQI